MENEWEEYCPEEVVIEITSQCNLKCMHCASNCLTTKSKGELKIEDWKKVIAELKELGTERIVYSGGEPTIKPGIEELLKFTKKQDIEYGLITNGHAISEYFLETIRKYRPYAIGVSIDGKFRTHNRIRGNDKSWQNAARTVRDLKDSGIEVCVVTVINKLNFEELEVLGKIFLFANIDSWQLQLAMPSGRMSGKKDLLIDQKDFEKVCKTIESARKILTNVNIQAADDFALAPAGKIRRDEWMGCGAGIVSMGIDAFGNVMPCLSIRSDSRGENIKEKSIREIWENSSIFDFNRKFKKESVEGECKECEHLELCRGGCPSLSYSYNDRFHDSPFCYYRTFQQQRRLKWRKKM